ncbi:MAG: hypothetical protein QOK20_2194, partial [Acidimicrobiaceae bacterium]|nr:hypothetical protein [Acidimicrobiaceae bacterium]
MGTHDAYPRRPRLEAVAALRERPGRDVNIIAVDLVDELSLMIEPILL